jgi:hypothetical protein
VSLLLTATLLSALLIAFGGVALVRRRPAGVASDQAPSDAAAPPSRARAPGDPAPGAPAQAATPMARLKSVLREGDWRRALPSLLVIAGLLGVMFFGSLSMVFVFGQTGTGAAALAVTVFAIARLAYDYSRA